MSSPALLHLLARRAKRKCGAAGSEPVNACGSEAAAGAPGTGPALSHSAFSRSLDQSAPVRVATRKEVSVSTTRRMS
jgi:hypothetical protein